MHDESDNVVRAALTPKFKDIETLLKISNFQAMQPKLLLTETKQANIHRYIIPSSEFVLFRVDPSAERKTIDFLNGPSIICSSEAEFIVKSAETEIKSSGDSAVLVPASTTSLTLENTTEVCWIASS
ncbi:MAG: hypothetical protein R3A13_00745 [Bdellovibrionota bacterium]